METETRLALLEQGRTQIVADINELKQDIKEIKSLLINNLVTQKDFQEYKSAIREEISKMECNYNEKIEGYQRSQFWQRVMSVLGGFGTAIIMGLITYELYKILK